MLPPPALLAAITFAAPPSSTYPALLVATLLFVIGFIGTIVPFLPGTLIVWLGIIGYKLWLGDAGIPWWFVFASGGLILIAQLFEILCGAWGAKKFGGTWRGATGALIGGIVGFFIPPPLLWIIIGPIIGAVVGELMGGRKFKEAGKAGMGTVVGAVVAFLIKIAVVVIVVAWFYLLVFTNGPTAA